VIVLVSSVAPVAADEPDVTRTVEATVQNIAVEAPEGAGSDLQVSTAVEVDGQLYDLPDGSLPPMETGDVVDLGVRSDSDVSVTEAMELVAAGEEAEAALVSVDPQTASTDLAQTPTAEGAVAHSLVILPVYWTTGPDTDVATLRALGQSTADYWSEQSGGTVAVQSIDVRGWQPVAAPASCGEADMTALYNAAVTAHGVPGPAGTRHVVVYFPDPSPCSWAGMATVGGGRVWVNGSVVPDVLAHEFGHNLGLGHANTYSCVASGYRVALILPVSGCTARAYGDYADVMGIGMTNKTTGSLNISLADQIGLAQLTDVATLAAGTGTFDIVPLASVGAQRGLRMPVSGGELYVDYRPAAGRDTRWSAWAGVQVHFLARDSRGIPTSYLLNLQPGPGDFVNPSLPIGQAWTVPGTGVALTVLSTGATARVSVTTGAAPGGTGDPIGAYVTRVYSDLFGRVVDQGGLDTWSTALRSGTPRVAVANAITYSAEYRSRLITGSYATYLGRAPDSAGLGHWLGMMSQGMTIQQMEAGFLASPEYYGKAGSTDAGWVRKLYLHVLGRDAAAAEVDGWVRALSSGMGRGQVAMGFLLSTEHLTTVVDGYYRDLLGRGIDPSGQWSWVTAIQNGTRVEAIIGGIVASDEYFWKG